jgi:ribosomal protein S12 methylthiotransferase
MLEKISKLREKMPDCVIRTSIIVGFPGETEEQFEELYDFVKEVRFDRMGVFAYSQEEDTAAADFPDQIDDEIKEERLDRLMTLQQGISLELNKEKIGKTLDVIVEGYDEESFLFYGRSRGDSIEVDGKVYFGTEKEVSEGDIIKVEILDADEYDLTGKAVD